MNDLWTALLLPGALEPLEESFFEMLTWAQLDFSKKPTQF
jgi:hypothetical protein